VPRLGARARIVHFGGVVEHGIVLGVHEGGRRLEVRDEAGRVLEYVLSQATAGFVLAGDARGARLALAGDRGDDRGSTPRPAAPVPSSP
jgi:hypothetical protein